MPTADRSIARATALIVLSSFSFGSLTTVTLFITRGGLPLLPAMVWRYFIAALVLLVLVRGAGIRAIPTSRAFRLMIIGGLGQAVITYLSLRALDYLPVGPLAFLFYTYPAWVAAIAAVTGKDLLTLPRVAALVIAMTGIVVMVGMPAAAALNTTGVILALGTALLYAVYLPALHNAQEGIPPLSASFFLVIGVLTAFFSATALSGKLQAPSTANMWGLVILLAVLSTVIAFVTLVAGLRVLGPIRTSIVSTIEPFFTTLLGVTFLRESFTIATITGGIL